MPDTRGLATTSLSTRPRSVAQATYQAGAIAIQDNMVLGRVREMATHVLSHPTVSMAHARITVTGPGAFTLTDLGSTNGTFVNGARLTGSRAIKEGDEIRIGPFAFTALGSSLVPSSAARGAELRTRRLRIERPDSEDDSTPWWKPWVRKRKVLLDDVSLAIAPGEFVAVIGPSGCGKSTLIQQLGGRSSPTSGRVEFGTTDLHRYFETVKHNIAYVAQRETLPKLLTIRDCLSYTARLRLPADTSGNELDELVRSVVAEVGLAEHVDKPIRKLSGGQQKRAALANELLVRPQLLLLDEVTSGLDESTDYEIMGLLRELSVRHGVTTVCVTHTLANVGAWCDSLVVMAKGGSVAYHGPVASATKHFDVAHLSDIYQELGKHSAREWSVRHENESPYASRVTRPAAGHARASAGISSSHQVRAGKPVPLMAQLSTLVARYLDIVRSDWVTLLIAVLQSVAIGVCLRLVFGSGRLLPPRSYVLDFLLTVSAFWFGCNNAAKEVIKESDLFALERDINLRIPSYILSKLSVLTAIGAVETMLLFSIVRLSGLSADEPLKILATMIVAVAAGTACGLFISAAAKSEDAAVSFVPIALIPQILLAEAFIAPLPKAAGVFAKSVITAYWTHRAELQLLHAPGVTGKAAWAVSLAHVVAYTFLAGCALWWRDRARRRS